MIINEAFYYGVSRYFDRIITDIENDGIDTGIFKKVDAHKLARAFYLWA